MPRGVPKAGFRKTKNWKKSAKTTKPAVETRVKRKYTKRADKLAAVASPVVFAAPTTETDDQIKMRLRARFAAMNKITEATILGVNRAVIVSGPPGLGKSFDIEEQLKRHQNRVQSCVVKGYARATGIYKKLYDNRHPNCVVVFDDADDIFNDETALNLLKAATDTIDERRISWLSEGKLEDENGDVIPSTFLFEGSVVFITNHDFDYMIEKGNRNSPHFAALISRSHYMDLTLKTKRDYLMRIEQVVYEQGMLKGELSAEDQAEIMSFVFEKQDVLRELSLRMVRKLATLVKMDRKGWKALAEVTCCRNA